MVVFISIFSGIVFERELILSCPSTPYVFAICTVVVANSGAGATARLDDDSADQPATQIQQPECEIQQKPLTIMGTYVMDGVRVQMDNC